MPVATPRVGLLGQHMRTCVITAARSSDDKLTEARRATERLLKI